MSLLKTLLDDLRSNIDKLERATQKHDSLHLSDIWSSQPYTVNENPEYLLPWPAFEAMESIRADMHTLEAAVTPTHVKLLELGLGPVKTSALNVVVTLGIPDAIERAGGSASLDALATEAGVNAHKLGRVIRVLAAEYIFQEITPNVFRNTKHSRALATTNTSAFVSLLTDENFKCATGLTKNLLHPDTKDSFAPTAATFCTTVSNGGETFEEYLSQPANSEVAMKIITGVVPFLNRVTRPALMNDYPWSERPAARVVDLGCGPADSAFDILRSNPDLRWTFQDLPPVIEQLKSNFPEDLKPRLNSGALEYVAQDYFEENSSQGDIWYLRGVVREYDDAESIKVLSRVAKAMAKTPGSRMIINEILISSPTISGNQSGKIVEPPSHLVPEIQSRLPDLANLMTWSTYFLFGGKERSYAEIDNLLQQAGLKVTRFFPFRSFTAMVEAELA